MLQYSTLEPHTLDILKELMAIPELDGFYLVGGTALALMYGHRLSLDLDLFSSVEFEPQKLVPILEKKYSGFTYNNVHNSVGLFGFIDDVKVDFVRYHYYPLIDDLVVLDGIRLSGIHDLMAMKVAAILKRGVKKDFWDIAEIINRYSIEQVIDAYNHKFPNQQMLISIPQALIYFDDADASEDPVSKKGQTWDSVKKTIRKQVDAYLK